MSNAHDGVGFAAAAPSADAVSGEAMHDASEPDPRGDWQMRRLFVGGRRGLKYIYTPRRRPDSDQTQE